jgi:hypothetical protein
MKLLKYSLFLLAPLGQLSAAVYTFDGLTPDDPLTTVPGITLSEANPTAAPLAYVGILNGSNAGALGGEFADATAASATLTLASSFTNTNALVGFDLLIKDSTNAFPSRDAFSFTVNDGSGVDLVQLRFLPVAQSLNPAGGVNAEWEMSYLVAGGSLTYASIMLTEQALYSFDIEFNGSGMSLTVGNTLSSSTFNATIPGFDGATDGIGNLEFGWSKTSPGAAYGDNTMFFDNVSVAVPEPSAVLLSGLASLVLLKRRRAR